MDNFSLVHFFSKRFFHNPSFQSTKLYSVGWEVSDSTWRVVASLLFYADAHAWNYIHHFQQSPEICKHKTIWSATSRSQQLDFIDVFAAVRQISTNSKLWPA